MLFDWNIANVIVFDCVCVQVCIHRMLSDPHIIRFYGHRKEGTIQYLFVEYASGGELFDRIGESF